MSLSQKIYEAQLTELKNEISRNPDADFTPHIKEFAAEIIKRENKREKDFKKRIVDTLLLDLYDGDAEALERDIMKRVASKLLLDLYDGDYTALNGQITKRIFANAAPGAAPVTTKAAPSERGRMFLLLCEMLSLCTKEDFADTIEMCRALEEAHKAEDE